MSSPTAIPDPASESAAAARYDFRQPPFLTGARLQELRVRHEEFAELFGTRLSTHFSLDCATRLAHLAAVSAGEFTGRARIDQSFVMAFDVEPRRDTCIVSLQSQLACAMADRLMGGPGIPPAEPRDLSAIEAALIEQAVQFIASEWADFFDFKKPGFELRTPRFEVPNDLMLLAATFDVQLGDSTHQLQLAFSCSTFESLFRPAQRESAARTSAPSAAPPIRAANFEVRYGDIELPLTAHWDGVDLSAGKLANLKVGDVIELNPTFATNVELRLAGVPKFMGHLGTSEGRWAIQISSTVQN